MCGVGTFGKAERSGQMGGEDGSWPDGFFNKREEKASSFRPEGGLRSVEVEAGKMHVDAGAQYTGVAPGGAVSKHGRGFQYQYVGSGPGGAQGRAEASYTAADYDDVNSLRWQ
jgi:hypothetical protein